MHKRFTAFQFAIQGIVTFFNETVHARLHFIATVLVSFLGIYFQITKTEWLILVLCMALVIVAEALNSALEYVVDLTTSQIHPLAKKAKDVAAAAVLLAALFSCIIAVLIFYPYLFRI